MGIIAIAGTVTRNHSEGGIKLKKWRVKLTVRRMGMQCQSCKQNFEFTVDADSAEEAITVAKDYSGVDIDSHQFQINLIKEIKND